MAVAKDLSSIDFAPHYVTRRYAEFMVSILYLSTISEDMGDISFVKNVNHSLCRLREELEKLLIRLADAKHKDWKSKTIFLMNNYDLIVNVMNERGISSVDGLQFQKLLELKCTDFAQDELNRSFGRIITFVKDHGGLVQDKKPQSNASTPVLSQHNNHTDSDAGVEGKINATEEEVEALLKEFHNNWKQELEQIHAKIMKHFFNFKLGMKVFNLIMEDLIERYNTFVKIIKQYFRNLRMSKYFTPVTEITYELKRLFVRFE